MATRRTTATGKPDKARREIAALKAELAATGARAENIERRFNRECRLHARAEETIRQLAALLAATDTDLARHRGDDEPIPF